ncbi:MAG: CDP-glucose 4,6-dehydratase [Parasporobacterium sp.]|nr:CDP-glucose 4,6-dehydratase [Parasporobacterium sp.]
MGLDFYKGKRVLITGHTGFKGTWLTRILVNAGADILGYSRCSEKDPDFFAMADVERSITHVKGDVRDYSHLQEVFNSFKPEIVFHLAAQPIVRESYADPLYTYETNVMGTANVLESIRKTDSVKSAVIITTDKVYRNNEWAWGYRENDVLDGFDPYSNSKSCAELVTASYKRSFPDLPPISTTRAGNVIGGGDFAKDRIIPDCVRAVQKGEPIIVRNPNSVRPFQHVLEPLFAYLLIAEKQWEKPELAGSYNIGPEDKDCITTGELVELFCKCWGEGATWINQSEENAPHEAGFLKLDCSLLKKTFGWKPKWDINHGIEETVEFSKLLVKSDKLPIEMDKEIKRYQEA